MTNVFKYQLPICPCVVTIEMPEYADILCVKVQHGRATLWAEVEEEEKVVQRTIHAIMTGQETPEDGDYIGTALLEGDSFVLHYFDGGEK